MSTKFKIIPTDDFIIHKFVTKDGVRETQTPLKHAFRIDNSRYTGEKLREIRKTHR